MNYNYLSAGLQKAILCDQISLIQKDLKCRNVTKETLQKVAQLEGMTDELFDFKTKASKIDYRYLIKNLVSSLAKGTSIDASG